MEKSKSSDLEISREFFRFVFIKYRKNWYWFALSVAVCTLLAFAYLTTLKSFYNIQASVLIKDETRTSSSKQDVMEELDLFTPQKLVENEIEILESYTLSEKVVNDLDLDVLYSIRDGFRWRDIYRDAAVRITLINPNPKKFEKPTLVALRGNTVVIDDVAFPLNKAVQTPLGLVLVRRRAGARPGPQALYVTVQPKVATIKSYVKRLRVSQANRSATVLYLNIEDSSKEQGMAYLDRLVYFYELMSLQDKNRVAANTLKFVETRLGIIARELSSVEKDIQNYKTNAGIVDLSAESTVFLDKVRENDRLLSQTNIQLGALDEIERYIASKPDTKALAPATVGLENPALTALLNNLLDLEMQRAKLIKTVPDNSAPIETIDEQLRNTKVNLDENIRNLRRIFLNTRQQLTGANRQIEATIRKVPQKERVLLDISRQMGIKANLYNYLLQKREETALSFAATVSDLRVVDVAQADDNPTRPIRRNYLVFALVMGLLIPMVILWLTDFFNTKISRKSQVEQLTQVPIIGEIIQQPAVTTPLVVTPGSRTLLAEQIRALRTNIQFMNPDNEEAPVVLITSSISGEGKSFISLNLAASFALTNRRVALVELDLRKPKLHRYLQDSPGVGLSSYLVNAATLEDIVYPVPGFDALSFVPCGILPPNPAELLGSDRMRQLFAELRQHYDVIIADMPPVGLVADASITAKYATLTIYIVRHLFTKKAFLKNIQDLYAGKRFPNMSVLINGIDARKDYEYNYGYGYDTDYGYNYRSVYHADEERVR